MPSSRDSFRRNRVAPVGTTRIALHLSGAKLPAGARFLGRASVKIVRLGFSAADEERLEALGLHRDDAILILEPSFDE
jgi:hypothetical protein